MVFKITHQQFKSIKPLLLCHRHKLAVTTFHIFKYNVSLIEQCILYYDQFQISITTVLFTQVAKYVFLPEEEQFSSLPLLTVNYDIHLFSTVSYTIFSFKRYVITQ
jgi:hypothetical protein